MKEEAKHEEEEAKQVDVVVYTSGWRNFAFTAAAAVGDNVAARVISFARQRPTEIAYVDAVQQAGFPLDTAYARSVHLCTLSLHDPDGATSHLGLSDENISLIWNKKPQWFLDTTRALACELSSARKKGSKVNLRFWCKSGRHRSVSAAVIFGQAIAKLPGFNVVFEHLSQWWWRLVPCQKEARRAGRACPECTSEGGQARAAIVQRVVDNLQSFMT